MALSAEEKNRRKQLRKERDRAWRDRYKERQIEVHAAEAVIEATYGPAFDDYNRRMDERLQKIAAAKEAKNNAIKAAEDTYVKALAQADEELGPDNRPFLQRQDHQEKLTREINQKFPDLTGSALWSAAAWKPLDKIK
jgi:hypothetical protein